MTDHSGGPSPKQLARGAGVLYLIIIVCGIFSEAVVRGGLVVEGDAPATAAHILAGQGLFRAGFVADACMLLADVAIAALFYVLLRPAGQLLALMAAAFRLTQAAVLGANLLNYHSALLVLTGGAGVVGLPPDQREAVASLFLDMHRHGYDLGLLFFALSTIMLGVLVRRSRDFPSVLGGLLMAAGVVYLAGSLIRFIAPQYVAPFAPAYVVPLVAELGFCGWLLIRGVRPAGATTGPR